MSALGVTFLGNRVLLKMAETNPHPKPKTKHMTQKQGGGERFQKWKKHVIRQITAANSKHYLALTTEAPLHDKDRKTLLIST